MSGARTQRRLAAEPFDTARATSVASDGWRSRHTPAPKFPVAVPKTSPSAAAAGLLTTRARSSGPASSNAPPAATSTRSKLTYPATAAVPAARSVAEAPVKTAFEKHTRTPAATASDVPAGQAIGVAEGTSAVEAIVQEVKNSFVPASVVAFVTEIVSPGATAQSASSRS